MTIRESEEPTEDALLREYQTCQQEATLCVQASWQSGLIFFVTTLALAGAIISGLVNTDFTWYRLFLIVGLGIVSIILLLVWDQYLLRQNFVRLVMLYRMEQIERRLGLRKNLYTRFLDETIKNNPLSDSEQAGLKEEFWKHQGRKPKGLNLTRRVLRIAIGAWILFMILEGVIFFCPMFHYWLLN